VKYGTAQWSDCPDLFGLVLALEFIHECSTGHSAFQFAKLEKLMLWIRQLSGAWECQGADMRHRIWYNYGTVQWSGCPNLFADASGIAEFWRMLSPPRLLHASREHHLLLITSMIAGSSTRVVSKSASLLSLPCAKAHCSCSQDSCTGSRPVHTQGIYCRQPDDTYQVICHDRR